MSRLPLDPKMKQQVIEALGRMGLTEDQFFKNSDALKTLTKTYHQGAAQLHPDKPTGDKVKFQQLLSDYSFLRGILVQEQNEVLSKYSLAEVDKEILNTLLGIREFLENYFKFVTNTFYRLTTDVINALEELDNLCQEFSSALHPTLAIQDNPPPQGQQSAALVPVGTPSDPKKIKEIRDKCLHAIHHTMDSYIKKLQDQIRMGGYREQALEKGIGEFKKFSTEERAKALDLQSTIIGIQSKRSPLLVEMTNSYLGLNTTAALPESDDKPVQAITFEYWAWKDEDRRSALVNLNDSLNDWALKNDKMLSPKGKIELGNLINVILNAIRDFNPQNVLEVLNKMDYLRMLAEMDPYLQDLTSKSRTDQPSIGDQFDNVKLALRYMLQESTSTNESSNRAHPKSELSLREQKPLSFFSKGAAMLNNFFHPRAADANLSPEANLRKNIQTQKDTLLAKQNKVQKGSDDYKIYDDKIKSLDYLITLINKNADSATLQTGKEDTVRVNPKAFEGRGGGTTGLLWNDAIKIALQKEEQQPQP